VMVEVKTLLELGDQLVAALHRLAHCVEGSARRRNLRERRTTGFEPATLSLGSETGAAWLRALGVVERNHYRWNPLETARNGARLARIWGALPAFVVLINGRAELAAG
jgi:hypothetical protein